MPSWPPQITRWAAKQHTVVDVQRCKGTGIIADSTFVWGHVRSWLARKALDFMAHCNANAPHARVL
jgi:hypothetical protein